MRDDPTELPLPLDYAAPEPPRNRADRAAVRFTAGVGLTFLVALGLDRGDDMPACTAAGLVVELAIVGGAFAVGRRVRCRRVPDGRTERHTVVTVGVGLLVGGLLWGTLAGLDWLGHRPSGGDIGACFLLVLAAAAVSPWWVYRSRA